MQIEIVNRGITLSPNIYSLDLGVNIFKSGGGGGGSGDMTKAVYDPNTINADAFDMDNMTESGTSKILTTAERSNISANTLAKHDALTLAGSLDYLTIANQVITRNAIDLTTDVINAKNNIDSSAIHNNVSGEISALTNKAMPVSNDKILIENSADSDNKYYINVGDLPTGGGGEANTGSNQGADGVGVFDTKSGIDLQFRNVAPASNKVTTTLNGKDIDINIVESNIKLDDLGAPDDNQDLDASLTKHGLMQKYPGGTTTFLRADGNFATPPDTGETNTISNRGSGISVVGSKTGEDLGVYGFSTANNLLSIERNDIDDNLDFTVNENNLDHENIINIGSNSHVDIDSHIADLTKHRIINDATTSTTGLWSSTKINNEIPSSFTDLTGDLDDIGDGTSYVKSANNFTNTLKTKLDGIETGATGDQTDAEIKTAYENNADTNAFTNALLTKLNGIEALAETNNISDTNATDLTDAGDSTLHYHSADRNRSNHTGTQALTTLSAGNWKLLYSNGSGVITELALAADGKVLVAKGTSSAPAFEYPIKYLSFKIFDDATTVATGTTSKVSYIIDSQYDGMNLVSIEGGVSTVSSSGVVTVKLTNITDTQQMLSTNLTIDASEKHSSTAATAVVIDTSHDDLVKADHIEFEVTTAGTGAKGLQVTIGLQKP